jgi:hypothetical protein
VLNNVVGVAIRDFKFGNELLINENNKNFRLDFEGQQVVAALTPGSYNNEVSYLISHINSVINTHKLTLSIDTATGRVKIQYTGNSYVIIYPTSLLRVLGFPDGTMIGICLYGTGSQPASLPSNVVPYGANVVAPSAYDCYNLSEMVLRIKDVEAILSNDAVTDRCTAILFNSNSSSYTVKQCLDHYIPLLQRQSRLQSLKIKLLNMEGDLYDTVNNEAVFLMEFYCLPKDDGICA